MKRILTFTLMIILTLSLLASCGGGSGSNSNAPDGGAPADNSADTQGGVPAADSTASDPVQASARAPGGVIYPSALLSFEDVSGILGASMLDPKFSGNKFDEAGSDVTASFKNRECEYWTDSVYSVNITLYQNETAYNKMMSEYMEGQIENPSESSPGELSNYAVLEGIGDKAYSNFNRSGDSGVINHIYIFYGDYYLAVSLVGALPNDGAWGEAKVTECAGLAIEHLKEILAGTRSPESVIPVSDLETNVLEALNKVSPEVVTPTMLITPEELKRITGEDMLAMESDKIGSSGESIGSSYMSESGFFSISIKQDALAPGKGKGMASLITETMTDFSLLSTDPSKAVFVEGLGDGAYYVDMDSMGWTLHFYYGAYWIDLVYLSEGPSKDTALAWQQEKLLEAGQVIVGHLKDIIG